MKNTLLLLLVFVVTGLTAQKNLNGKIYDKHPTIEIVNKFTEAYVSGDVATIESLVTDDFIMYNTMNNNPNYKGGDVSNLIGQTNFIKNNMVGVTLKDRGAAYSDALEFKNGAIYVYTYQMFTAYDKSNGFKIKTPRNSTFIFDKTNKKIRRLLWADNTAAWDKWRLSNQTIKNGTIYKDHPLIAKVRMVYYNLVNENVEETFKDFSPNARIYDSNLTDKKYISLEEQKENVTNVLKTFEMISIDEIGYPDYLDYEGNGGVALSWWEFTLKNRKTGDIKKLSVHSQMWFNEKGMIGREDVYYNANLLQ